MLSFAEESEAVVDGGWEAESEAAIAGDGVITSLSLGLKG